MTNSPEIERLREGLRSALKSQASALAAHDAALAKLEEKRKEHAELFNQLEAQRASAAEKDGVDAKAVTVLSNIRETVEISQRQLQRLEQEASKAVNARTAGYHQEPAGPGGKASY
jgi:chromosome segregation ATPase